MRNTINTVVRKREDQNLYLQTPTGELPIPNKAFPTLNSSIPVDVIIKPHRMKDRIKYGVYRKS